MQAQLHQFFMIVGCTLGLASPFASATALWTPRIQRTPCASPYQDPDDNRNFPAACIRGEAETSLLTSNSANRPDQLINSAEGYAGLHIHRLLSYHLKGVRRRIIHTETQQVPREKDDAILDESFVQFGNPAYHRPRLALGRINLPYGLDFSPLSSLFAHTVKTRRYWVVPTYALRFTFDNLLDTQLELGYGTDDWQSLRSNGTFPAGGDDATSFRLSHDISALGGSRIMLMAYASQKGERRMGAAFLNKARNGAVNSLEWQRRRHTSLGRGQPLQQIFRLNYEAADKQNPKVLFEFEHDHKNYWLLSLGQDYRYENNIRFRLALSYYSTELQDQDSHWIITIGTRATL